MLEPTFRAFAAALGLRAAAVPPYRAQTKGKVESGVKYVKRNFLPGRAFVDDRRTSTRSSRAWQAEIADRAHPRHHPRAADRSLRRGAPRAWCPRAASRASASSARAQRIVADDWLVAIDDQPLLGAVPADRPDRRGAARRRPAGRILHRGAGRRRAPACSAARTSSRDPARARPRRRRARNARQRYASPRRRRTAAARSRVCPERRDPRSRAVATST